MDVKKKHVLVSKECVYDQELISACIIGLLASSRERNIDDVLACELAAYPPSMFNPDDELKIAKLKLILKQNLRVAISEHNCPISNTMINDVYELILDIAWPSNKLRV